MLLALAMVVVGRWTIPATISHTGWVPPSVPDGAVSVLAEAEMATTFPLMAMEAQANMIMIIRAVGDTPTVLTQEVAEFEGRLAAQMDVDWRTQPVKPLSIGYFIGNKRLSLPPQTPLLRYGFVSSDTRATLMVFTPTQAVPPEIHLADWQVRDNVLALLNEFASQAPEGTEALVTGPPAISADSSHDDSIKFVAEADSKTIPCAMIILSLLIGDLRLMLIPPLLLTIAGAVAFTMVLPYAMVATGMPNDLVVGMGAAISGLGLDYSLFLLTRFQENRAKGMCLQDNVYSVIENTGHTIGVSGSLVAVAFGGAYVLPQIALANTGVGMAITTVAVMLVSSTVIPAVLLFAGRVLTLPICGRRRNHLSRRLQQQSSGSLHDMSARTLSAGQPVTTGPWFWLLRRIERSPTTAMLAVFLAFTPLLLQLPRLHCTADSYAMLPETMPSVHAMRIVDRAGFPIGRFQPYEIVFKTDFPPPRRWEKRKFKLPFKRTSAMLTEQAFNAMLELAKEVNATGGVAAMLGPVWLMDKPIDFETASDLHIKQMLAHHPLLNKLYTEVLFLQIHRQSAYLQVHSTFLPVGAGAADWVIKVRKVIDAWNRKYPDYEAVLSGGAGETADMRDALLQAMKGYIGLVVLGVTLLVLVMFRGVLLALRLGFALLFTLAATFAVAVVVFQTTLLHPWFPWLADYNGIVYNAIPLATTVAIALGLDYDIFLITRVLEYRLEGYDDRDSIVMATANTGNLISGAGMVMMLAFSGLMFSTKLMMKQMGLLLVVSVFFDTFVVRTVLVPAMMLAAGKMNWWPRVMPEPTQVAAYRLAEGGSDSGSSSDDKSP
eukprot:TRINITY_DN23281_c0_g2_i1.p1 TRINITY_DN23281_c0_g2~~TRINITY_DN23281_c0_g2_i1.p1  ORF type:complete len:897 (+),score=94.43 TRINITY_DN23281_c0_g2_i1:201-2693(+)